MISYRSFEVTSVLLHKNSHLFYVSNFFIRNKSYLSSLKSKKAIKTPTGGKLSVRASGLDNNDNFKNEETEKFNNINQFSSRNQADDTFKSLLNVLISGELDHLIAYVPDQTVDRILERRRHLGISSANPLGHKDIAEIYRYQQGLTLDSFAERHILHCKPCSIAGYDLLSSFFASENSSYYRCQIETAVGERCILTFSFLRQECLVSQYRGAPKLEKVWRLVGVCGECVPETEAMIAAMVEHGSDSDDSESMNKAKEHPDPDSKHHSSPREARAIASFTPHAHGGLRRGSSFTIRNGEAVRDDSEDSFAPDFRASAEEVDDGAAGGRGEEGVVTNHIKRAGMQNDNRKRQKRAKPLQVCAFCLPPSPRTPPEAVARALISALRMKDFVTCYLHTLPLRREDDTDRDVFFPLEETPVPPPPQTSNDEGDGEDEAKPPTFFSTVGTVDPLAHISNSHMLNRTRKMKSKSYDLIAKIRRDRSYHPLMNFDNVTETVRRSTTGPGSYMEVITVREPKPSDGNSTARMYSYVMRLTMLREAARASSSPAIRSKSTLHPAAAAESNTDPADAFGFGSDSAGIGDGFGIGDAAAAWTNSPLAAEHEANCWMMDTLDLLSVDQV